MYKRTVGSHDIVNSGLAVVVFPAAQVVEAVVLKSQLQTTLQTNGIAQFLVRSGHRRELDTGTHLVESCAGLSIIAQCVLYLGIHQQHVGIAQQTIVQWNMRSIVWRWTLGNRNIELHVASCALVLAGRDDIGVVFCPRRIVRHAGLPVVQDGPLQADRVTGIFKCFLQIAGRQAPRPTGVVARADNYRDALTQTITDVAVGLNLKEALLAVVVVHAPHIAKVVEQLIFLAVDDGFELSFSLFVFLLIEINLSEQSLGSPFSDTSKVFAAVCAAHGQVRNSLEQIFLDLCIGLFFAGALYAFHL